MSDLSFDRQQDVEPILNDGVSEPDWASQRASELLPCIGVNSSRDGLACTGERHNGLCPAYQQSAIAQALRNAEQQGIRACAPVGDADVLSRLAQIEEAIAPFVKVARKLKDSHAQVFVKYSGQDEDWTGMEPADWRRLAEVGGEK